MTSRSDDVTQWWRHAVTNTSYDFWLPQLNQLNHEVSCKDEMLKFVDQEIADRRDSDHFEMRDSLIRLNKECQELKTENANLKDHVSNCVSPNL
jgi:hypothetical protein